MEHLIVILLLIEAEAHYSTLVQPFFIRQEVLVQYLWLNFQLLWDNWVCLAQDISLLLLDDSLDGRSELVLLGRSVGVVWVSRLRCLIHLQLKKVTLVACLQLVDVVD